MLKKIFLLLFALGIIVQAVIIGIWNSWLVSSFKLQAVNYLVDNSTLNNMVITDQNELWAVDFNKIDVYKGGQFIHGYSADEISLDPGFLVLGPQNKVWNISRTSSKGMAVFDGQTWTHVDGTGDFYVWTACVDAQGQVWLGAQTDGLYRYDGSKWMEFSTSNSGLPSNRITALATDQQGRVWVGTDQGVVIFDGQNWQTPQNSPLSGVSVIAIAFDRNGHTWIGTSANGLYDFDGTQWTQYTSKNSGLEKDEVAFLVPDQRGNLWLAGTNSVVQVFDGKSWKYMGGYQHTNVISMLLAPDGTIYVYDGGFLRTLAPDTHLLSSFERTLKSIYDQGVPVYETVFLIGAWFMIALNAWGMGAVLAGGLLVYIVAAVVLPSNSYFNPGLIATVTGLIGGLIGYFFKRSGKRPRADLFGGLIGFGIGLFVSLCLIVVFLLLAMVSGA